MKYEKQLSLLTAALMAFFLSLGTLGCLVTAFRLDLAHPRLLVWICGGTALVGSALLSLRYGSSILICILALSAGYLYRDTEAGTQLMQLLQRLSTIYDRAYGWGVLQLTDQPWNAGFADWPLGILGCLIALAVSRCICRQKSPWLPVLMILLPLCSCIVVTDTVPEKPWLLMVFAGLILLTLTSSVRQENALQGLRLTLAAALPVILSLLVLFAAIPQDSYVNQSKTLQQTILTAVEHLPQLMETGMSDLTAGLRRQPPRQVDLAGLGPRIPFTYPVMEVTSQQSGTLYLRDQDYDQYDSQGWISTGSRQEAFPAPLGPRDTLTIRTRNPKDIRYLPYYPEEETLLLDGNAENPTGEAEYTSVRILLPTDWRQTACQGAAASGDLQQYLALPEITRQGGTAYVQGRFGDTATNTEKADIIAALVIDSAAYDLNTSKMPADAPDFALWFLEEAHEGYCVHFATAAAVLMRCANVPARYVTGYMLEARAGETITVTEENAHAWVEYYEPNLGLWIPLEATPAAQTPAAPTVRPTAAETQPPEPTEETRPPEETTEAATLPPESTAQIIPETEPVSRTPQEPWRPPVYLILLPLFLILLPIQRAVRLSLRRKRQRTGDPNSQALGRWREAVLLARLLKESPTEELIVLAQKAKFSQHRLSQEELLQFDSFNRSCLRRLKKKSWYLRLFHQYIYAAY